MLFVLKSTGGYVVFDGMSESAIVAMLAEQGITCTFVDEVTYNAANTPQRQGD